MKLTRRSAWAVAGLMLLLGVGLGLYARQAPAPSAYAAVECGMDEAQVVALLGDTAACHLTPHGEKHLLWLEDSDPRGVVYVQVTFDAQGLVVAKDRFFVE